MRLGHVSSITDRTCPSTCLTPLTNRACNYALATRFAGSSTGRKGGYDLPSRTWGLASLTGQTDWSKALVPHETDRNPAGRSQPASIGDHWLCPWYSAPSFSSSARIVATRLSRILTI